MTTEDELAKQGYNGFIVKVDQASNAASVAKTIRIPTRLGRPMPRPRSRASWPSSISSAWCWAVSAG
ncbi:MAG: hypothetical protein WDN27_00130 [Candidatus Saccharibacteria bacterium]